MRYVWLAAVAVFSIIARPVNAQSLSITNYQLISQQTVTATQSRMTYTAKLVNAGGPLGSVAATASTSNPFVIRTIPGQDTLNFAPVPGNSQTSTSGTFTILVTTTQPMDFSNLQWTFQSTAAGPVANPGANQTVSIGSTAILNGSGSTNSSGSGTLTYSWQFTSRPAGTRTVLMNSTSASPSFVVDVQGSYIITLTVSNGTASNSASVTVSTFNSPPVANPGPNQTVAVGSTVTVNGSGSSDVDGDPLTYQWTLTGVPAGSSAILTPITATSATFVADKAGSYTAQLIVNDGKVNSAPASVTIATSNTPPVANAGSNQTVSPGATVQLTGAGSTDVDGNSLTYQWSLITKPAGSGAALSSASAVNPTFTADVSGTYVAQLIVNDGQVNSAAATVTIVTSGVQTPTANAGSNQTVLHGANVQLNGSGTDPQGLQLTYSWSLTSKPAGSSAVLSGVTSVNPTFVADQPGNYIAQLIVSNGFLNSAPATVTITTTNTPPVANAGANQTVTPGATVTLNGGSSSDADHDPLTYSWSFLSRPTNSLAILVPVNSATPQFLADLAGTYVVQLIVNDGIANSNPTTVSITAATPPAITLTPNPLNFGNNVTGTLTVTLSSPAGAGGQIVNLSSSNTSVATVPAGITVPQGSSTANVTVAPGNAGSSTVTASASGFISASATVNIANVAQILLPANVTVGPSQSVPFQVTLATPSPSGTFISLSSSDTSKVTVNPTLFYIPAGANQPLRAPTVTGVTFGIVTISASASGLTPASQQMEVTGTLLFQSATSTVTQGTRPSLTLTLSAPAPAGGLTVNVNSSNPSVATVPASVTFAANSSTVSVPVSGIAPGSAVIHANNLPLLADTTASLTVIPTPAVQLPAFMIMGQWGSSGPLPVSLSVPAPPSGVTITLSSSNNGMVSVSPASVFIPGGATVPVTLPTVTGNDIGSVSLSASAPGYATAYLSIHVTDQITIGLQDSVVLHVGQTVPFIVCLPQAAPAGGVTVTLWSGDTTKLTMSSSVFIPAGSMLPAVNAQVTGVSAGSVTVHASATGGFSSEIQTVQVIP